ncbi:hypothetical protein FQV39_18655 [Bosea sp. F3-2]|uniref:hypothetical protein n=1 Tax=Bosea sp. F3-2 TaxID=2599640 RepID=UPI0011EF7CD9|nr:hypothetical protein [Bosea sp. F3-2]QEL24374.1 hypothetical protein FQV39_18655 [Bosea sp. F3-2]
MLNALAALPSPIALLDLVRRGTSFVRCQDEVRYTVAPSSFGPVLFAISRGRVVSLELGRDAKELVRRFKATFPRSREAKGDPVFWDSGVEVLDAIEHIDLPNSLDQAEIGQRFAAAVRGMLRAVDGNQPAMPAPGSTDREARRSDCPPHGRMVGHPFSALAPMSSIRQPADFRHWCTAASM